MAHYAFINEDNIVVEVIAGIDETDTENLPEGFSSWEEWYGNFKGLTCKRTSYNTIGNQHTNGGTPFRGNYGSELSIYDAVNDVFYEEQPFPSWTVSADTNWLWKAPLEKPDTENVYDWNEDVYQQDNTTGWILVQQI